MYDERKKTHPRAVQFSKKIESLASINAPLSPLNSLTLSQH